MLAVGLEWGGVLAVGLEGGGGGGVQDPVLRKKHPFQKTRLCFNGVAIVFFKGAVLEGWPQGHDTSRNIGQENTMDEDI